MEPCQPSGGSRASCLTAEGRCRPYRCRSCSSAASPPATGIEGIADIADDRKAAWSAQTPDRRRTSPDVRSNDRSAPARQVNADPQPPLEVAGGSARTQPRHSSLRVQEADPGGHRDSTTKKPQSRVITGTRLTPYRCECCQNLRRERGLLGMALKSNRSSKRT